MRFVQFLFCLPSKYSFFTTRDFATLSLSMGTDCREVIIEDLELLRRKEQQNRNVFKMNAYDKVINGLRRHEKPIYKIEDIDCIPGVGDRIRSKIKEIIDTGKLEAAEEVKKDLDINAIDTLLKGKGSRMTDNLLCSSTFL